jgi:asparagine synthase (glutamine-hydrolysing)
MCGICGWISETPLDPEQVAQVRKMNCAMNHRGPDGEGELTSAHVALAMRRLSIIDLKGGWQPLYNEDRSLALIANGEIYNFIELRKQLEACGHRFSTATDCETILHLYEDHGLDCVHSLRGMFTFALWDAKRKRLVLARDRMGEKPLYFHESKNGILFASEMKALLASGQIRFELNQELVHQYFHYNYVPEPGTPVKDIRKLDAGSMMIVDVDPWQVRETCYWRMEDAPALEGDPARMVRSVLETVSELVIRSDVPVGLALSGGLDSGVIAALTAARYPGTLHAFTIGYAGRPSQDEREPARSLADLLKIPFHEIELNASDMTAFFPELVFKRDDPIADMSGYGYYMVMNKAREFNVPVMLQGQGGDELFWGYTWLRRMARQTAQKANIFQKGWGAYPAVMREHGPISPRPVDILRWLVRGCGTISALREFMQVRRSPAERVVFYDTHHDFLAAYGLIGAHYSQTMAAAVSEADPCRPFTVPQPWPPEAVLLTSLVSSTYLRENGITQGDRLSMASSVELRLPLLDYKLVETVIGLRKTYPDYKLPMKAWLKDAVRGLVPDEMFDRPKKGFASPRRDWHQSLFEAYGKTLDGGYLVENNILSPAGGQSLAQGEYTEGSGTPLTFKALVLETWCRKMSAQAG